MDLGISVNTRKYPRNDSRPLTEIYDDCIEIATYAEELGWDHLWLPEHHMSEMWATSPMTVLAAIAARTSKIRIGTYILLLSLHDPFRIAEDIATVDVLSHGRLDIGIGAAPEKEETAIWGIEKPQTFERTYESMRLIQRFFSEKEVTHHGKYYDYDSVTMAPMPVQPGGPPFWVAAMGPQSAERAAKRGYYFAAGGGRSHDIYVNAWRESGRDPAAMKIVSVPLSCQITSNLDEAWDEIEESFHAHLSFYRARGVGGGASGSGDVPPVGELRKVPGAGFGGQALMLGTPDQILRQAEERFANKGITELELSVGNYIRDPAKRKAQMKLFADEIMPVIRKW